MKPILPQLITMLAIVCLWTSFTFPLEKTNDSPVLRKEKVPELYQSANTDTLFFDDFESQNFDPAYWSAMVGPNNGVLVIEDTVQGNPTAYRGNYAVAMGKSSDSGGFNVNTLDLQLDLSGEENVFLSFWIRDYADETQPEDGLWLSDDGGQTFVKAYGFDPVNWIGGYGKFPPLSLDKLAEQFDLNLSSQFVIRFQQADNADFNISGDEDGWYLDDVAVYRSDPIYATLPYTEDFESGQLSESWRQALPMESTSLSNIKPGSRVEITEESGAAQSGSYALALGRITDGTYTVTAIDLNLDLSTYAQAELSFGLRDYADETHGDDGIWFSDDGGATFAKVYQLDPASFTGYQTFTLDIDSLAFVQNLRLSSEFVVRFQQGDDADFNTAGDEDGFYLDDISVTGSLLGNEPVITDFDPIIGPAGTTVTITGENFTADAAVSFNGRAAASVSFIDEQTLTAVVPQLATTGKISVETAEGQALSVTDFVVPGAEVIFYEDFETGTLRSMWTAQSSTPQGIITVVQEYAGLDASFSGFYGVALGKTTDSGGTNINTLDLAIPLAAYQSEELLLSFAIKDYGDETQAEDGIYFSADGGTTFKKAYDFAPSGWSTVYGPLPPLDLDELAAQIGLSLTDDFVIRFQQADNADFITTGDEDGWFLDNILIQTEVRTYARLPFQDGFESGELSSAWRWANGEGSSDTAYIQPGGWVEVTQSTDAVQEGFWGLRMGRRVDGNFTVNALDLQLDLSGEENIFLSFWLRDYADETQPEDGLWLSDDGGQTFVKAYGFDPVNWIGGYGKFPPLSLDKLAEQFDLNLSSQFVIRFQQGDNADFNTTGDEDGWFLDDVAVYRSDPIYATLPYTEDFESGQLSESWRQALPMESTSLSNIKPGSRVEITEESGAAQSGSYALALGRITDGTYTVTAIDLNLNLSTYAQAELSFGLRDYADETHGNDGIWFSDDGGATFAKVYQLDPASFSDYQTFVLDIDSLAFVQNLRLSSEFVVRFQQGDDANFNTAGDEDGFYLDDISVTGSMFGNEPIITSFDPASGPAGTTVTITGENFTADAVVNLNGRLAANVNFIDVQTLTAVVPQLATTGKISVETAEGQALSSADFVVPDAEVIFYEDFETGTLRSMWTAQSSTPQGIITVVQEYAGLDASFSGFYGVALGKTTDSGGTNINTLDLAIPLAAYQSEELLLSFAIKDYGDETQAEDGIYFSADGGTTFKKAYDFAPSGWSTVYGPLPPLDLDELAAQIGLSLTDDFVIRFQQADNADFITTGDEDGWFLDNILIQTEARTYARLPFRDGFESGELSSAWRWANGEGSSDTAYIRPGGWVEVTQSTDAVQEGFWGLRMGRRVDGNFTVNALDLQLDLSGEENIFLSFWLRDYADETQPEDGLWLSDDGGQTFVKAYGFDPVNWIGGYGKFPPLSLDKLAEQFDLNLSSQFVIRFQQADNADFNISGDEDGWYLDDVAVYRSDPIYATLPYTEDFESGQLSESWRQALPMESTSLSNIKPGSRVEITEESGAAQSGSYALALGRITDGTYTVTAIDLNLDLSTYAQAELSFGLRDYADETHGDDGIWFSDDGGATFAKVYQLDPASFSGYQTFVLDIDSLAFVQSLRLSSEFVVRFQQGDDADFNTFGDEDGFYLDDISVTGSLLGNEPVITNFAPTSGPAGTTVTITGENFTVDAAVSFNGRAAASVSFIDGQTLTAVVPQLASTGKISVETAEGQALSVTDFVVPDAEVIFYEDFETGTLRSMWTAQSSTPQGIITVAQRYAGLDAAFSGFYGVALGKTMDSGGTNINTLDLAVPLAAYQSEELLLSFAIKDYGDETQAEDGIYFSADGGTTFKKAYDFAPSGWSTVYGPLPPLDLDELAAQIGLSLTDDFVIRFQQADNADFITTGDEDGWFLDDILIQTETRTYARLPFRDGFESGGLSSAWRWANGEGSSDTTYIRPGGWLEVTQSTDAVQEGFWGLRMGRRVDGNFTVNALDLQLDLSGYQNIVLNFWLKDFADETHPEDGLWLSADGGQNWIKGFDFDPAGYNNSQFSQFQIDLDQLILNNEELSFSNQFIIRFQQADNADFNTSGDEDGFYLDNISVEGELSDGAPFISYFEPLLGFAGQEVTIRGLHFSTATEVRFNDTLATYTILDENTILATIPSGATTGKVSVTNPIGTGFSPFDFTVIRQKDVGITQISTPETGCGLTGEEEITVTIRNFGGADQANIPVSYILNGSAPFTEVVPQIIPPGETIVYTFSQGIDLTLAGSYDLEVFTALPGDENLGNDEKSKDLTVFPAFEPEVSPDPVICRGEAVSLTASGGEGYRWSTGATTSLITVRPSTSTTYRLTVTNDTGCSVIKTIEVVVLQPSIPQITYEGDLILCPSESLVLTASLTENIQWSTGETTPSIEVTQAGNYSVTFFDENGCTATSASVNVGSAPELGIKTGGIGAICLGDSETLTLLNATNIQWSTGESATTITVSPTETTVYSVTATSSAGCLFEESIEIEVLPNEPPGVVSNMLPSDGAVEIPISVPLSWAPAPNASHYDFYIWKAGTPVPTQPARSNLRQINFTYNGNLDYEETYQWQMVAKNPCFEGEAGPIQSFTTRKLPDLIVTHIQAPPSAIAGQTVTIDWTVKNIGRGDTQMDTWFDRVIFTDIPVAGEDRQILSTITNLSALTVGESYTRMSIEATIPRNILGNYYFGVIADGTGAVREAVETNNTSFSSAIDIDIPPPPDLQVTSLVVSPLNLFSSANIEVTWTVQNLGTGSTFESNWTDRVYLSDTTVFNPATSTLLGTFSHTGALEVNASYPATRTLQLPDNISGDYYIFVVTDANESVFEYLDEDNNTAQSEAINVILAPPVDLAVSNLILPAQASVNQPVNIQWTTVNQGASLATGGWVDRIYVGSDPVLSSVTLVGTGLQTTALEPGESVVSDFVFRMPDLPAGDYYLFVTADANENIDEPGYEGNNTGISENTITIRQPDLTVNQVVVSPPVLSGQLVTVQWTLENLGIGDLYNRNWIDRIYLSEQEVFDLANASLLRSVSSSVDLLSAGSDLEKQTEVRLPNGIQGPYYLHVVTDAGERITEIQENNNVNHTGFTVQLDDWSDLQVTDIQPPMSMNAGESAILTFTIQNFGLKTVENTSWTDRIYLSPSSSPEDSDLLLLQSITASEILATGQDYTVEASVSIPADLPGSEYYFLVETDAGDHVFEYTNEDNNRGISGAISLTAYPPVDLAVTEASVGQEMVFSGKNITLNYTVKNLSEQATISGSWVDLVVISQDTVLDVGDTTVGQFSRDSNLGAGRRYERRRSIRIPDGISGNFFLIIQVDRDGVNNDAIPENNTFVIKSEAGQPPVMVELTDPSDLMVTSFSASPEGISGQPVSIQYQVQNDNIGSTTAGNWVDRIYLSTDFEVDASDQVLLSIPREQDLEAGAFYEQTVEVFLPIQVAGNFILLVKTDAGNDQFELAAEDNNTASFPILITQPPPGDLIISDIVLPALVFAGTEMAVFWTLRNDGPNPVEGFARDAVYLSKDTQFDAEDVLLGTVERTIDLANGETTQEALYQPLRGVSAGEYFIIIRADVQNNIGEVEENNNTTVSVSPLTVLFKELELDLLTADVLVNENELYYQIMISEELTGETLVISLDGDEAVDADNELYLRFGEVPTRNTFDFKFSNAFTADQEVIVSALQAGTYYLLAYGSANGVDQQDVELLAKILPFEIRTVEADEGGNTGKVTVRIEGAKFETNMEIRLESDEVILAEELFLVNSTQVYATFDLTDGVIDSYDVVIERQNGQVALLPDGFSIVPGLPPDLKIEITHPAATRPNRIVPIKLSFVNEGNVDVPVPIRYVLSLFGAPLSSNADDLTEEIDDLYVELRELPELNTLRPGAAGTLTFFTKAVTELRFVVTE